MTPFEELRAIILNDSVLMAELTSASDQPDLFAKVIALSQQYGLWITITELEEIVRANRRSWLERGTFQ
jgi:hypothetical protein